MALSDPITGLLKTVRTIAVVGLSRNPMRASHGVSAYMQGHGYRIIPVNPKSVWGRKLTLRCWIFRRTIYGGRTRLIKTGR